MVFLTVYPQALSNYVVQGVLTFVATTIYLINILEAWKIENPGLGEILWRCSTVFISAPDAFFQLTFGTLLRVFWSFVTGRAYVWPEKKSYTVGKIQPESARGPNSQHRVDPVDKQSHIN